MQDLVNLIVARASEPPSRTPSIADVYRFFLTVYGQDQGVAKNAFLKYMQGDLPAEVLRWASAATGQETAGLNPMRSADFGNVTSLL
jgi:hypothetical protein